MSFRTSEQTKEWRLESALNREVAMRKFEAEFWRWGEMEEEREIKETISREEVLCVLKFTPVAQYFLYVRRTFEISQT